MKVCLCWFWFWFWFVPSATGRCTPCGSHGNRAASSASLRQRSHRNRSDTCQSQSRTLKARLGRRGTVLTRSDPDSLWVPAGRGAEGFGGEPLDLPAGHFLGHDGALMLLEVQKSLRGTRGDVETGSDGFKPGLQVFSSEPNDKLSLN